jgi:hypothetical protein
VPGRGWRLWRGKGEVVADVGVAAGIAASADLAPELGGVGAASFSPLAQVGPVFAEHAGPAPGAVADQQSFCVAGPGEPADRVAGQA